MNIEPARLKLFHHPPEADGARLRLTIEGDRSYLSVKPVWAAPLSWPNTYLTLLDGKGEEIALVPQPRDLPPASWEAVQRDLRGRYLTATVTTINSARQEFGATYWHVETDRGPRDFVTQNLQENAQSFSDTHLLLLDVDGNRFEIPDTNALNARSRNLLYSIV